MKYKIPKSPFATHLSGSAKETELRIRNIFQWKRKRPPVVMVLLGLMVVLLCGTLVSCQKQMRYDDAVETPNTQQSNQPQGPGVTDPVQNGMQGEYDVIVFEGETIAFPGGDFEIKLPQSWNKKVGYVVGEQYIAFCHLASRNVEPWEGWLFDISRHEEPLPLDYEFSVPGWVVASTDEYSYKVFCASDVQSPNNALEEYMKIYKEAKQIRYLFNGEFAEKLQYDLDHPKSKRNLMPVNPDPDRYLQVIDGVFVSNDGQVLFDSVERVYINNETFWPWAWLQLGIKAIDGELPCETISTIRFGGKAGLAIEINKDSGDYCAKSITAFGNKIEFRSNEFPLWGNMMLSFFEQENCVILSSNIGHSCIITEDDTFFVDIDDSIEDYYTQSVIWFYSEGETVHYKRTPLKFYYIQTLYHWFNDCVSRDELYLEEGTVTFENGLTYHPTYQKTISEQIDMDAYFKTMCENHNWNTDGEITLDEYLAENAAKYKRAY